MKGFKILGEKPFKWPIYARRYRYQKCTAVFFRVGTGSSKCGTSTTLLLPIFSALVPVPIFSGTGTTLQKFPEFSTFWISLYAHFFHCFIPLQTDLCLLNCVLHSLSTFTLTLESFVLLGIKIPRVKKELANQGSRRVQRVDSV